MNYCRGGSFPVAQIPVGGSPRRLGTVRWSRGLYRRALPLALSQNVERGLLLLLLLLS